MKRRTVVQLHTRSWYISALYSPTLTTVYSSRFTPVSSTQAGTLGRKKQTVSLYVLEGRPFRAAEFNRPHQNAVRVVGRGVAMFVGQ